MPIEARTAFGPDYGGQARRSATHFSTFHLSPFTFHQSPPRPLRSTDFALLSAPLFADPVTVDSLPAPVQTSLKGYLQNPQESVENIETYDWGPAVIYKISIALDGKPYLELHIADTGQVLRTDENGGMQDSDDDGDNADASPSPSASPKEK